MWIKLFQLSSTIQKNSLNDSLIQFDCSTNTKYYARNWLSFKCGNKNIYKASGTITKFIIRAFILFLDLLMMSFVMSPKAIDK